MPVAWNANIMGVPEPLSSKEPLEKRQLTVPACWQKDPACRQFRFENSSWPYGKSSFQALITSIFETYFQPTLFIFQIMDSFSTLTHSSFVKTKLIFEPEIRDLAL